MLAILAPVPAEILESAFQVRNSKGIVAFGTGAIGEEKSGEWSFNFFSKSEISDQKGEMPVLIYGSKTDVAGPHPLHDPTSVVAVGTYIGFSPAVGSGHHLHPEYRPQKALDGDLKYSMFWEIIGLRSLVRPIPLKQLELFKQGKVTKYAGKQPIGPLLVSIPDEYADLT